MKERRCGSGVGEGPEWASQWTWRSMDFDQRDDLEVSDFFSGLDDAMEEERRGLFGSIGEIVERKMAGDGYMDEEPTWMSDDLN
ncbi:hypothetical protein MRB53_013200 [Persea americana]|uniref:Uncharacterized protein n=1 Tax=Persea americana TaxID=3435 RepID=A0ACC2K7D2_PERAE|nr:hypothetical protein MRB53_013200 [Persea americana]